MGIKHSGEIKISAAVIIAAVTLVIGVVGGFFAGSLTASRETVTVTVTTQQKVTQVGLVLSIGGLGDKGFNDAAYAGVMEAREKLGIEFDFVQPRAIAEFEGLLRDLARTGKYSIIIAVGFYQVDPLNVVAAEFPNQKFAIIDAIVDKPNVASLIYEEHEGAFLTGVVAGLMTKTNKVGFVGGLDIPLIRYRFVGWSEGVKWANPNAEVFARYAGAFDDPAKGKELALQLIDQGVDVVFHVAGRTGLGVLDAARERGVYAQGSDQDQSWYAPNTVIASLIKGVQLSTFEIIKSVVEGNFRSGIHVYGLKNGGSDVAFGAMIPQEVKNRVNEAKQLILKGELKVTNILQQG